VIVIVIFSKGTGGNKWGWYC